MRVLSALSDTELLTSVAASVQAERIASADLIEHLVEVERRRLYLEQACSSLYTYCRERLGYSEDAALKRARVARLALRLPRVLEHLQSGSIHLTGLFLLDRYLNEDNAEGLLAEARGKSRRELEQMLAIRFPRPDVPPTMEDVGKVGATVGPHREATSGPGSWFTCPGTGTSTAPAPHMVPLFAERYRIQFTASAALRAKIEEARELLSHALPDGDLAPLLERALDCLIERERKRRVGTGKPRRSVKLRPGSRHVPLAIARQVWERDGSQCAFVDAAGRRCSERRFLSLEHRHPFALGGSASLENLCLLCKAHNAHTARQVFGEAFIVSKMGARQGCIPRSETVAPTKASSSNPEAFAKVRSALTHMGFHRSSVASTLSHLRSEQPELDVEPLLRAALNLLTPPPS